MNVFYSKIETALTSLREGTNLKIALKRETVTFCGLSSPYKSHRSVEIFIGHGIPELVVFSNGYHTIAATPKFNGPDFEGPHLHGVLPAFHLRKLFKFPASAPSWLDGLVKVVIIDLFEGFDDDGQPRFSATGKLVASRHHYGEDKITYVVEERRGE